MYKKFPLPSSNFPSHAAQKAELASAVVKYLRWYTWNQKRLPISLSTWLNDDATDTIDMRPKRNCQTNKQQSTNGVPTL